MLSVDRMVELVSELGGSQDILGVHVFPNRSVHLTEQAFNASFNAFDVAPFSSQNYKKYAKRDGIEFFCLCGGDA